MPENKTKIFTPASPKKASFFEFKIENSNNTMLVLAWNFFNEIKSKNSNISDNFINIKDLEK